MRLLVHAVRSGEEKNAKWVGPNCFFFLKYDRQSRRSVKDVPG